MPKDPVGAAADFVFRDQIPMAEEDLAKTDPEFYQNGAPEDVRAEIRKTARALFVQEAQAKNNLAGRAQAAVGARMPVDTFNVGPGILNPRLEGLNAGNALEFMGMGPKSLRDNPSGAVASAAATGASFLIPPLVPVGMAARFGPGMGRAANVADKILRPAVAAGAAGGLTEAAEVTIGVDSDAEDPMSASHVFAQSLSEAARQAAFEVGGGLVGTAGSGLARGLAKYARGNKEFFDDALESLRLAGIRQERIALQDVSDRALVSSAQRTVGVMPIPFIAPRFERAVERRSDALGDARDEMIGSISPTFSIIRNARSSDPSRYDRAMRRFSRSVFRKVEHAVDRYRAVRRPLEAAVDTEITTGGYTSAAASVRSTALNLINQTQTRSSLPSVNNPATGTLQPMQVRRGLAEPVDGVIQDVANMRGGTVGLSQLVNLRRDVRNILNATNPNNPLQGDDRAALLSIEGALDNDIESAITNSGNQALIDSYARLNELDSTWITLIRGHVGSRARMVDETFGRQALSETAGRDVGLRPGDRALQRNQGALDQEQFLDSMLKEASPEEIRQFALMMRSLGPSGERTLRATLAKQVDDEIERATVKEMGSARIEVIKPEKIDQLANGTASKESTKRFWALVDEAGVDRRDVTNFTKAAKLLWRQMPTDTNTYIARRIILQQGKDLPGNLTKMLTAGLIGGSATAAGGVPGGAGAAVFGAFLIHSYSNLVTNPRRLQWVLRALDPKYGTGVRAQAIERIVADNVFRDWFSGQLGEAMSTANESAVGSLMNRVQGAPQ